MDQEYDNWNVKKQELSKTERVYFSKGDIGKYYHKLISFTGSIAILSQVRLFDARRLLRYIGKLENKELKEIKIKIGKIV